MPQLNCFQLMVGILLECRRPEERSSEEFLRVSIPFFVPAAGAHTQGQRRSRARRRPRRASRLSPQHNGDGAEPPRLSVTARAPPAPGSRESGRGSTRGRAREADPPCACGAAGGAGSARCRAVRPGAARLSPARAGPRGAGRGGGARPAAAGPSRPPAEGGVAARGEPPDGRRPNQPPRSAAGPWCGRVRGGTSGPPAPRAARCRPCRGAGGRPRPHLDAAPRGAGGEEGRGGAARPPAGVTGRAGR